MIDNIVFHKRLLNKHRDQYDILPQLIWHTCLVYGTTVYCQVCLMKEFTLDYYDADLSLTDIQNVNVKEAMEVS